MSDKYLFTQTTCPKNIYLLKQYPKYLFTQYVPSQTICPINIYLLKQYVR